MTLDIRDICPAPPEPHRVPRPAPRRDAILALIDGSHSARDIAEILCRDPDHARVITPKYVRSVAHAAGLAGMLRPASGTPLRAPLPPAVILRDLRLPPDVARRLLARAVDQGGLSAVLRALVIAEFQEEAAS